MRLYLSQPQIELVIYALRSSKGDGGATRQEQRLADQIEKDLANEVQSIEATKASDAALAAVRAERAKNAVLTERQAGSLAAVRAGKSAFWKPWSWQNADGTTSWSWRSQSNAGGAVGRMILSLVEEGLLTERGHELTPEGRQRLESYEQKHGHVGP